MIDVRTLIERTGCYKLSFNYKYNYEYKYNKDKESAVERKC